MLMAVTKMNLSPVFGLYPDPEKEAEKLLDSAVAGKTPLQAVDKQGVLHRLWPVTDVSLISALSALMGPKPVFIADGHHRYETSCKYRDQVFDSGILSATHPANYTLMMFVAMEDPGLIVMPTHRLFRGVPEMTSGQLAAKLGDCFTCRAGGRRPGFRPPSLGRNRNRRQSGRNRTFHPKGQPLDHRHTNPSRPGTHGRSGQRP